MATEMMVRGMKIVVETETERAKREMQAVAEAAQKNAKKISLAFAGDNWSPNTPNNTPYYGVHQLGGLASYRGGVSNISALAGKVGSASDAARAVGDGMMKAGKAVGSLFQSDIVKGGMAAAGAIADTAVRSMMRFQEVSFEIGSKYFDMSKEELRNARWRGAYEGQASGASTGAGIGATIGGLLGAIGGPAGIALGSLIGGGVGSLTGRVVGGLWGGKQEEEIARLNQMARWSGNNIDDNTRRQERYFGIADKASNWALEEIMSRQGGRTGRISVLQDKLAQVRSGGGDWSIKNIIARLANMSQADKEGYEGQKWQRRLEQQQSKADDLALRIEQLKDTPRYNPLEAGFGADEYARKGLYVGAQINVQDVNREILAELKRQTELYQKFAENQFEHGVYDESDNVVGMLIR